jgi:hypothetical protein
MRHANRLERMLYAIPLYTLMLVCLIGGSGVAFGQLSSATVTGLVRDPAGANVPGSKVVLRSVDTNTVRETNANASGNYSFTNVPPGNYTLEFSASGFNTESIAPFELTVNQTLTVEGHLSVGSVQTSVEVTAEGTGVEASTAELGGTIGEKQVHDLPLNGRNFTALLVLTPGVTPISVGQNQTASNTAVTSGSAFSFPSVNGQSNRANNFMIDGMNDNQAWYGTYAIAPIIDSIQEFKVNSHNDAQFGQSTGGVVNVATKAGTNQLHGSAWEYIRNTDFDAANYFSAPHAVTAFHQNQFGGTLGGPIVVPHVYNGHDKTFFFIGAEHFIFSQASNTSTFLVPTPAQLTGDFSGLLTTLGATKGQLFDPATGLAILNNNLNLTKNGIDAGALAFSKLVLPAAQVIAGSSNNAVTVGTKRQSQYNYTGRIDQTIGSRDFIFFRYSGDEVDTSTPATLKSLTSLVQVPTQQYGASWVHMFGPETSLQVQYSRAHVEYNTLSQFGIPGVVSAYGVDPAFSGFIGGVTLMPTLTVTGYFGGGESSNPAPSLSSIHQYKATYTTVKGRHSLQAGVSWDQVNYTAEQRNATDTFSPSLTAGKVNGTASSGDGLAAFLLGYPASAQKRNISITERPGGIASGYIQDSWKVTPRLTVNYGLRYDRDFVPAYGQQSTAGKPGGIDTGDFDFKTGQYILQEVPQACSVTLAAPCIPGTGALPAGVLVSPNTKIIHPTKYDFGPRLGMSYSVNSKLAIHGAFGIYYDNWAAVIQLPQQYQGQWPDISTQQTGAVNGVGTTYVSPHNPFASVGSVLPGATPFAGNNGNYVDPNVKNPYSEQYNLGIQQEFPSNLVFTLNYVGSQSHRLDIGGYYNVGEPSPYAFGSALRAQQIGINGPQQNGQAYGNIQPVSDWDRSQGEANYNALQASLARALMHGLAYTASFTWSKSIDLGQSGEFGAEGNELQNPYNLRGSRGVSAYNIPQVLAVSIVYDLPVGKGKAFSTGNRYVDYIAGNWQTNTIFTERSGQNFTIAASGDPANVGNPGTATSIGQGYYARATLTGISPIPAGRSAKEWFNQAAFNVPTATDITIGEGNSPRNALLSQQFYNVDFSVVRRFPIVEKINLEFRAEAFNVLNHTVFGVPVLTVNTPTTFGQVTSTANSPRQMQFAAKVTF